jgi:hypothetical protein
MSRRGGRLSRDKDKAAGAGRGRPVVGVDNRSELRQAAAPPLAELVAKAGIGVDATSRPAGLPAREAFRQMLDDAAVL